MEKPRVIVVGAGFGGLTCARSLAGKPADVLLLDRHDYHLFTPLLYQVATALLSPGDIAYPLRKVFRRTPNVRFRMSEVVEVDLGRKIVHTADGATLPYDDIVLAPGSTTDYFGSEKVAQVALGLKDLGQALRLRNHTLECLEAATRTDDPEELRRLLTFVVVGAGPTGVEYAGAFAELVRLVLPLEYREVPAHLVRIVLVEGRDSVLPTFHHRLGRYTARALERLGVEVRTGTFVTDADVDHVALSDDDIVPTRTLVWSAGVRPAELAETLPIAKTGRGRLEVDEHCRVTEADGAWAVGDTGGVLHEGEALPMIIPPAMQQGRYVARAILDRHLGDRAEPDAPFVYRDKGAMATIGRSAAVAEIGPFRLTGLVGWTAWLVLHLYYLIGFRNRLVVMMSWAWNYLRYDRPIRFIALADREPVSRGRPEPRHDDRQEC